MRFKRVLHPVGHGAFFTEYLRKDGEEKSYLNVVYDCGSTCVRSVSKALKNEIDITFDQNEHIDLLFISHFDEDHTNGLSYLLDRCLMDNATYAVVPFAYPYIIMVMDDRYPSLAEFIRKAIKRGIRLIGLKGNVFDRVTEGAKDVEPDGRKLIFDADRLFKAVDTDSKKIVWYFYPFMKPDFKCLQTDFDSAIDKRKESGEFTDYNLNDAMWVLDHLAELKTIYQSVGKKRNGVTAININSLLMASFPAGNVRVSRLWPVYGINKYLIRHLIMSDEGFRYFFHSASLGPSCLYTGDTVLARDMVNVVNHVKQTMFNMSKKDRIDLMQIPHHGSRQCFPAKLANDLSEMNIKSVFVNCAPYSQKTPMDPNLTEELTLNSIFLFLIYDNYCSRLETYVKV